MSHIVNKNPGYLLVDAARAGIDLIEQIAESTDSRLESLYLFNNESNHLKPVAPYMFDLKSPMLCDWYRENGWGNAWGIIIKSELLFDALRNHLRKFLKVRTDDGKMLFFRFYDPRVLRIFLPTCDTAQIRELFGNAIEYFIIEDEDPAFSLRMFHQNGILQVKRTPAAEHLAHFLTAAPLAQQSAQPMAFEAPAVQPQKHAEKVNVKQPEPTIAPPDFSVTEIPVKPKTRWNMFD